MAKIQEKGKISPFRAIADFFKGYFNFRGRTTRAAFWWTLLFLWLVFLILGLMYAVFELIINSFFNLSQLSFSVNPFLYVIILLATGIFIPILAMISRRLFDIGLTGKSVFFWIVGLALVKFLGLSFQVLDNPTLNYIFFMLTFFFLVAFFIFSLLPTHYFYRTAVGAEEKKAEL